jgi:hypothetical protein
MKLQIPIFKRLKIESLKIMIPLFAYELILMVIRLIKSGLGGALVAWPLYLGVLAGSQLVWLEGWGRYFAERLWGFRGIWGIREIGIAIREALEKLKASGSPDTLLVRNVLFMPMWLALAIFAFTSTSGWFPKGAILGMGWQWFNWKLNSRPWGRTEKLTVLSYAAIFCFISFLI